MNGFAGTRRLAVSLFLIFVNAYLIYSQPDSIYRLPIGTRISVQLDLELSSNVASAGDTFLASVAKPVVVRNIVVVPAGTVMEGRVISVERAAVGGRNGKLAVVFETLRLGDQHRRIDAVPVDLMEKSNSKTFKLLSILVGGVAGAVIGAVSDSGAGSLLGAAAGVAIGSGVALLKKGENVRVAKGREIYIELKREVILPVFDY